MTQPEQEPSERAHRSTVVHRVEISYRTILAVALTVGGIWLLDLLLPILVVIVVALMLVGTLSPAVGWLERRRVNRTLAIAVVFIGCAIVVVGAGLITIPSLFAQVSQTITNLPEIQKGLAHALESHRLTAPLANAIRTFKPEDRVRGST